MAIERRRTIQKQPSETFDITIEFTEIYLHSEIDLETATATAIKWPRRQPTVITPAPEILETPNGLIDIGSDCFCGQVATFRLVGGVDDFNYKITVLGTFSDDSIIEEDLWVEVRAR